MFGDALSWYMTSVAEFWGSAWRIGLPQILLIVLIICWLRRKGGSGGWGKGCCWTWCCKRDCDEEESGWSEWEGDRGSRCCKQAGEADADDEGDDDE